MIYSNTGFKLKNTLQLISNGDQGISLPYINQYQTADDLYNDIPNCLNVQRWYDMTGIWQVWDGAGTNFDVTPGEAYRVSVSQDTYWLVVGSHNPSLSLTLLANGYANNISIPYHTTLVNADGIKQAIPNCIQVSRWNQVTGTVDTWTGRGNNFTLIPGEGLIVRISGTVDQTWKPPVY